MAAIAHLEGDGSEAHVAGLRLALLLLLILWKLYNNALPTGGMYWKMRPPLLP